MISRIIKNDEVLDKWNSFKKKKSAILSVWILFLACFFSFTAEFWANSKPLILKYQNSWYFPVLVDYKVDEFGIKDLMTIDYRSLKLGKGDIVVWPLIKWDPFESNKKVAEYPAPPSLSNLMGTDDRGRDVLTRLLYGLRYSITYAIFTWILTFTVGVFLGGVQGYFGGLIDLIGQRVTEILSTVPQLFLLIILISIFSPSLPLLIAVTSIFGWIPISYYMRAEYLKNRKTEYVESARAIGCSHFTIFWRHIFRNSLAPIITFSPFTIAANISALAMLDYLGFGLIPPTPSWGELLSQAHKNFTIGWWLALYPSLALFCVLVMLNLVGEGARDAMDPHKR